MTSTARSHDSQALSLRGSPAPQPFFSNNNKPGVVRQPLVVARFPKAALWKQIVAALETVCGDANFECSASGISLQAMDSSHVSLVALFLGADGFQHYHCRRNTAVGTSLRNMAKIVRCAHNDEAFTLTVDDGSDHIRFDFQTADSSSSSSLPHSSAAASSSAQSSSSSLPSSSSSSSSSSRAAHTDRHSTFELKLVDIDSEYLSMPQLAYEASATLPSLDLQRISRDLSIIADCITICIRANAIVFTAHGETGRATILLPARHGASPSDTVSIQRTPPPPPVPDSLADAAAPDDEFQQTFTVRYLLQFARGTLLADSVTLGMSRTAPMLIEYQLEHLGYLRYYLAPRLEVG